MEPSLFRSLFRVAGKNWYGFLIATTMVLISNCLLVINPLIFRQAVMTLDPSTGESKDFLSLFFHDFLGPYKYSLAIWTLILVIVAIASAYFKYKMRVAFITISRKVEAETRSFLFDRILNQSSNFFDWHRTGELMSRLTNDITAYRDVLGPGMMYPIYFITLIVPALIGLFSISVPLALLSLLPITILPPFIFLGQSRIYNLSLSVQKSLADLSTMAHEIYAGVRTIKAYAREPHVFKRFCSLCKNFQKLNLRWIIIEGLFFPFLNFITRLVTVALVLLAGFIILQAWGTLSAADFVSFMWLQSFIFGPILMMGWVLPFYIKGQAAYFRLVEIYDEPNAVHNNSHGRSSLPSNVEVKFQHLNFVYPNNKVNALTDINLKIPPGSFVGITGPIGAGKSTLIRLLARDYEISRGMIAIGGHDIHDYSLEALRKDIAIVEQYPFLFAKTIAENVSLAKEEASIQEIQSVSELADLHETIVRFPQQYLTIIGERGITLSGGQKQRLAIARALLLNKNILLLDDIFSAVDAATEKKIFASIKSKFAGKTVVMVTHRISALEKMDRVVYMIEGKIVEEGSPEQLAKKKGPYAALLELQKLL